MEFSVAADEQQAPDVSPQWYTDARPADMVTDAAPVPHAETDEQHAPLPDVPFEQLQRLAALLGREAGRQEQAAGYLVQAPADVASLANLLALLALPTTSPQEPLGIFLGDLPGLHAAGDPPDGLGVEAATAIPAAGITDGLEPGVPLLQSYPALVSPGSTRRAAPKKRRARILKEGQLTMIVYGQDEALLWAKRVATFQQAMREVLGDRRRSFTWSGSIIDSVVGAFLTQNVSDFLSSKAFMELASRFPVRKSPQPPPLPQQEQQRNTQALGQPLHIDDEATPEQMPTETGSEEVGTVPAGAAGVETAGAKLQLQLGGRSCDCVDVEDTVDWEAVRTAPHEKLADAIKCRGMQFSLAKRIHTFLDAVISHNRKRSSLPSALPPQQQKQQLPARGALKGPTRVPPGTASGLLQAHGLQKGQEALEFCQQGSVAALVADGCSETMVMPAPLLSATACESRHAEQAAWPASRAALPQTVPQPSSSSDAVPGMAALGMAAVSSAGGAALLGSSSELPNAQHGMPRTMPASSDSSRHCTVSGEPPCAGSSNSPSRAGVVAGNLSVPAAAATTEQSQPGRPATAVADRSHKRQRTAHPVELEYEEEGGLLPGLQRQAVQSAGLQQRAGELSLGGQGDQPSLLSLEWLRDVSDEEAREYLMSVDGLGRKSVACIMLLTLGRKEFPVDTNVGRICARLGWIPLDAEQTVEELDDYAPEPEVHKYLHSRLMPFDLETLYELHYQMITLGKVFCSKASPNCRACPMQGDCEYALNNGPSLHGRKRQRRQDMEVPPLASPGAQQAQQGEQGAPVSALQHAEQAGTPVAGPASPLAQPRPPRRSHQRSKHSKGESEPEQDALEDETEADAEGNGINVTTPSSKARTAGAAARQPRRQHVYAQPVQLGPDDVDLDTVLSLVQRQRRTGGVPFNPGQPPAPGTAGASPGEGTSPAAAVLVAPVAERMEDVGSCLDVVGRLIAGSSEAADEAGNGAAALKAAARRSGRRSASFEDGHGMLRRSQRSIPHAAGAAAVPGGTAPQPLGLEADVPAVHDELPALGMPHRMVRRSQGPVRAGHSLALEAAAPGKGSRELWQLLRAAPVLLTPLPPTQAAALAVHGLPGSSTSGRVLRSQAGKPAAASTSAAAPDVDLPTTCPAAGKAIKHHSPSKPSMAAGRGAQLQAAAAAAAAVPEPTSPLPTTRSGRAVRHPRREEFVEEEEALAAVPHVKQESGMEEDGAHGVAGRDADIKPREASPAYLPWVLRHTPRKPRSVCRPLTAAVAKCPAVPAAAADTEPAATATPAQEAAVPTLTELPHVVLPEAELGGHTVLDGDPQGADDVTLVRVAGEKEPGRQQLDVDQERGRVPKQQQQQQRQWVTVEGSAGSPRGLQGEESTLRRTEPSDLPQVQDGGLQDSESLLRPEHAMAIKSAPRKWYKRGPLGAGLKGLAAIPAALRMFQAAAPHASSPRPTAAATAQAAVALGGAAGCVGSAEPAPAGEVPASANSPAKCEAACRPAGLAPSPVPAEQQVLQSCQIKAAAHEASECPPTPAELLHFLNQANAFTVAEATAAPPAAAAAAAAALPPPAAAGAAPAGGAALPPVAASAVAAVAVGDPQPPSPDMGSCSALPGVSPAEVTPEVSAIDVAEECARLIALGQEMELAQRRMAVAVGNQAAAALHEQRIVELALQAVGVTAALHAASAHSVVSTARRQYRVLSMKIHPDKCGHPLAPSAFAVLSHAFSILSQAAAAATALPPNHGPARAAPTSRAAASAAQAAPEDPGPSGQAAPLPAALASPTTAAAAAAAVAAEGVPSAVESAQHDQALGGAADPEAGQQGSKARLAADNPRAVASLPGGAEAWAGTGPLSAKLAPLPLGEQLVWTHQRRVVQAFVIPPHMLPELPPLTGITGSGTAAAGGSQPDPLLFVPLAALAGGEGAAGEGRQLLAAAMLPRLPPAVAVGGSDGEAAAEVAVCATGAADQGGSPCFEASFAAVCAGGSAVVLTDTQPCHCGGLEECTTGCQVSAAAVRIKQHSRGEPLSEFQCPQQEQQHQQQQQVEENISVPAVATQLSTAAEVVRGPCHAAAAAPGTATAPGALTAAGAALEAPAALIEGADDAHEEGVILVTCRTAMQGRFPLNGTYFQMNEVFVDQATAEAPVKVSRQLLAGCDCCAVHFGHSIHYMAKGMTQQEVANMFARGHVCFRAYDPLTGAPMPLPAFLAPSVPKTAPSNWKPKAALRAAERAARAAAAQHAQQQQERYPWLPAYPPVLDPLRLVAVPSDLEAFVAPPAVVPHDAWPWHAQQQAVGLQLDSLMFTPTKLPGRRGTAGTPGLAKRHKAAATGLEHPLGAPDGAVDGGMTGQRKRVQEFPIIRRGERCGWCHTCLNPRLKKACLTRRKEMEAAAM